MGGFFHLSRAVGMEIGPCGAAVNSLAGLDVGWSRRGTKCAGRPRIAKREPLEGTVDIRASRPARTADLTPFTRLSVLQAGAAAAGKHFGRGTARKTATAYLDSTRWNARLSGGPLPQGRRGAAAGRPPAIGPTSIKQPKRGRLLTGESVVLTRPEVVRPIHQCSG